MQIGCNKDLVSLSAEVLCQLTGTAKRKSLSDVALNFSALTLCVSQDFRFQPPRSKLPSFSESFSSYFFLSEHFVFLNFSEVFCAFCLWGTPEVQQAMMHMNSWHCGFKSDSWPLSQVTLSLRTFTHKTKETVFTRKKTALVLHSNA